MNKKIKIKINGEWVEKEISLESYKTIAGDESLNSSVIGVVGEIMKDKFGYSVAQYYCSPNKQMVENHKDYLIKLAEYKEAVRVFNDGWVPNFEDTSRAKYYHVYNIVQGKVQHYRMTDILANDIYMKSEPTTELDNLYLELHRAREKAGL